MQALITPCSSQIGNSACNGASASSMQFGTLERKNEFSRLNVDAQDLGMTASLTDSFEGRTAPTGSTKGTPLLKRREAGTPCEVGQSTDSNDLRSRMRTTTAPSSKALGSSRRSPRALRAD
jgi:hypothetical protein